jgi:cell division protein FtsB
MAALRQRNEPVRLLGRRLLLGALFILVVIAAFGVWNVYEKERESAALKEQAQSQLSDLAHRQTQLNSDIATLQTGRGKEAALRQEYALAAKGEGLIIIIDPASGTPVQATSSAFVQWLHKTFPWW